MAKDFGKIINEYGKEKKINPEDKDSFFTKIIKFIGIEDAQLLWHAINHKDCAKTVFSAIDIAFITAVVAYVIIPTDAIPDFLPIGLLDDYGVVSFALMKYKLKLQDYKEKCM